jgi:hypothetical protein
MAADWAGSCWGMRNKSCTMVLKKVVGFWWRLPYCYQTSAQETAVYWYCMKDVTTVVTTLGVLYFPTAHPGLYIPITTRRNCSLQFCWKSPQEDEGLILLGWCAVQSSCPSYGHGSVCRNVHTVNGNAHKEVARASCNLDALDFIRVYRIQTFAGTRFGIIRVTNALEVGSAPPLHMYIARRPILINGQSSRFAARNWWLILYVQ